MHKELICYHSDFFRATLDGSFNEAENNVVDLPEDDVEVFKDFETWLYTKKLLNVKKVTQKSLHLIKVFIFADKIRVLGLKNATLDKLRMRATKDHIAPATPDAIHYAWENTAAGSPLRRLLTDIFAYNVKPESAEEDILAYPIEFIADVTIVNMRRLPIRLKDEIAPFEHDATSYHEHDSSCSCCSGSRGPETAEETPQSDLDTWGDWSFSKKGKKKKGDVVAAGVGN